MTTRSNRGCSVTSTDVLIAMLSSDLRGSWAEVGGALRRRRTGQLAIDPAAGPPRPQQQPAPAAPEEPAPADEPGPPRP